jgi:hypothetical protein
VAAVLVSAAVIAAVGAGVPWAGAKIGLWGWPRPSSWLGVVLGLVGGTIVFFEMALLPRKWLRWLRLVPTKWWMRLHVWLGLVCLPVILVHAGFGLGGPLAAVTLVLFLLVTASGIWGLVMQQWLPEKMLAEVPAETVASQIEFISEYHTAEALRLIDGLVSVPAEELVAVGPMNGAIRNGLTGQPATELAAFRDDVLVPYLRGDRQRRSPLASRTEAGRRFAPLRAAVPEAALPVVERLEQLADLRRQWDRQARLNAWLHNWLVVHLPLSVAMTGLMIVHAVRALKYW